MSSEEKILPSSSSSSTSSISPSNRKQPSISCASPSKPLQPPPVLDVAENANNKKIDISYFDSFPPGYRFCPFDEELVVHYLKNKVTNQPLPRNKIMEVNLYRYNPEKLAEGYRQCGEKEWYFFTPRDKKYRNGTRPNRAAGDGYWKATGADKAIKHKGVVVGFRKALVFYKGKPPKGDKTNWIMHEYRVNDAPPPNKTSANDMRLDDWVLCRIYKKAEKPNIRARHKDEETVEIENNVTSTDHFPVIGMDVDYNSDSPGYTNVTNTFADSFSLPDLPNVLPDIPQFETAVNYGNPYGYDSCMGIAPMSEPVFARALQTMPSSDGIFTSKYLNDSFGFKSKTCQEEWPYHANYGAINIDAAPQLDMVSLENIMPTNTHSNLSNQCPDLQSNSGWH